MVLTGSIPSPDKLSKPFGFEQPIKTIRIKITLNINSEYIDGRIKRSMMRIVPLDYGAAELVILLGLGEKIVGAPKIAPPQLSELPKVDNPMELSPTHVVGFFPSEEPPELFLPESIRVLSASSLSITKILEAYEDFGRALKVPAKGKELAQKIKSQILHWGDSFYDRLRAKKVVVISSIEPLRLYGGWITELYRMISTDPQAIILEKEYSYEELVAINPHVIVVAPTDYSLEESKRTFLYLEKKPNWEKMWATKRGEIYFTSGGLEFYSASPNTIINASSILISAVSGLESGYISPKDSYVKARYLELFRHTLK